MSQKFVFESGTGKTLTLLLKEQGQKGFIFMLTERNPKGPKVKYGKALYTVDRYQSSPTKHHLKIVKKSFRKTKKQATCDQRHGC